MKKMTVGLLSVFTLGALVTAGGLVKPGLAQENKLYINKTVRNLSNTFYQENIDVNSHVFRNNEQIEFQIRVENRSGQKINNIRITDRLPENLSLIFNPGTYDTINRTISWTVGDLENNANRMYTLRARVSNLPTSLKNGDSLKRTNEAEVKSDQYTTKDTAYYYIGGTTLPVTGNEDLLIKSVAVLAAVGAALYLRKKGRGY